MSAVCSHSEGALNTTRPPGPLPAAGAPPRLPIYRGVPPPPLTKTPPPWGRHSAPSPPHQPQTPRRSACSASRQTAPPAWPAPWPPPPPAVPPGRLRRTPSSSARSESGSWRRLAMLPAECGTFEEAVGSVSKRKGKGVGSFRQNDWGEPDISRKSTK